MKSSLWFLFSTELWWWLHQRGWPQCLWEYLMTVILFLFACVVFAVFFKNVIFFLCLMCSLVFKTFCCNENPIHALYGEFVKWGSRWVFILYVGYDEDICILERSAEHQLHHKLYYFYISVGRVLVPFTSWWLTKHCVCPHTYSMKMPTYSMKISINWLKKSK